jgi:hypothetical protein
MGKAKIAIIVVVVVVFIGIGIWFMMSGEKLELRKNANLIDTTIAKIVVRLNDNAEALNESTAATDTGDENTGNENTGGNENENTDGNENENTDGNENENTDGNENTAETFSNITYNHLVVKQIGFFTSSTDGKEKNLLLGAKTVNSGGVENCSSDTKIESPDDNCPYKAIDTDDEDDLIFKEAGTKTVIKPSLTIYLDKKDDGTSREVPKLLDMAFLTIESAPDAGKYADPDTPTADEEKEANANLRNIMVELYEKSTDADPIMHYNLADVPGDDYNVVIEQSDMYFNDGSIPPSNSSDVYSGKIITGMRFYVKDKKLTSIGGFYKPDSDYYEEDSSKPSWQASVRGGDEPSSWDIGKKGIVDAAPSAHQIINKVTLYTDSSIGTAGAIIGAKLNFHNLKYKTKDKEVKVGKLSGTKRVLEPPSEWYALSDIYFSTDSKDYIDKVPYFKFISVLDKIKEHYAEDETENE